MWFDKENKVIIETLSKAGAMAYISFLQEEERRHIICLREAGENARVGGISNEYWQAKGKFWESAVARHKDDIRDIKALIEKVRELFE